MPIQTLTSNYCWLLTDCWWKGYKDYGIKRSTVFKGLHDSYTKGSLEGYLLEAALTPLKGDPKVMKDSSIVKQIILKNL